jgi:hypothetical protein
VAAALATGALPLGCGSSDEAPKTTPQDAATPPAPDAPPDREEEETDAAPDASPPPQIGGVCSVDGWCWDLPLPQGNDLYSVWGSDRSHLFAVGQLGTLLRLDGGAWTNVSSGTREAYRGVWGTGPDDVWAIGDQLSVIHYDGTAWSVQLLPATTTQRLDGGRFPVLAALAGTSRTNVWVVGEGGTILHFDGARWSNPESGTSATLRSVFANQEDDAWAVGDGGVVVHFDGATWTLDTKAGLTVNLLGVHGAAKDDVWAVGAQGTVGHFDGSKWTKVVVDATTTFRTVVADTPDSVWAAGDNGSVWHLTPSPASSDGGDAATMPADAGPTDAAADATVRKWTKVPNGSKATFYGAFRLRADDVCFVGARGEILRWNAGSWERIARGGTANRLAISAAAADDVWIVGDETLHLGKQGWTVSPAGTDRSLYGLSYASGNGGWAVGTAGTILRLERADAGAWSTVEGPSTRWLHGIWTSGNAAGWIVGGAGTALALLNGAVWQPISTGGITVDLLDVWGSAVDDVWAVGQGGTILHWRTTAWALVSNGADGGMTSELRAVWGAGAKDVWAVGAGGTIVHYDGMAWSTSISGEAYSLNDVWGTSATNVWAVGTGGTILHWDGSTWKRQESGTDSSLNTVGGIDGRVWAAGENSTVLRYTVP